MDYLGTGIPPYRLIYGDPAEALALYFEAMADSPIQRSRSVVW